MNQIDKRLFKISCPYNLTRLTIEKNINLMDFWGCSGVLVERSLICLDSGRCSSIACFSNVSIKRFNSLGSLDWFVDSLTLVPHSFVTI